MPKDRTGSKFSRKGLHRLACESCDGFAYSTVAQLEAKGLPACGWCGDVMQPERIELALVLGVETLAVRELFDRTEDKERSQLRSLGRNRVAMKISAGTLNDMSTAALDEISAEQRQQARTRQLTAILPTPEPMPF